MEEQKSAISGPSLHTKSESYAGSENHMCSSEEFANTRFDSSSIPVSESSFQAQIIQTEKKAFTSGISSLFNAFGLEINPHQLKRNEQKEKYIWYGAYEYTLLQQNLMNILKNTGDPAAPMESAAIHLDQFDVVLGNYQKETRMFLKHDPGATALLKLYLITKDQFTSIVNYYNNKTVVTSVKFEELKEAGTSYTVSDDPYGRIIKLGELDGIDIVSLTSPDSSIPPFTDSAKATALLDYLRMLYKGLRQSFALYSEHMILYYLYKRPGINGAFSTKHFIEICGLVEKHPWKKSAVASTETDEPVVKIATDNSFGETVKCSTMHTVEDNKGGINLLELPSVDEESCTVKWLEKETLAVEHVRKGINKGESSLLESEDGNSMCTNNLVGIEEDVEEGDKTGEREEETKDISQIQPEEITTAEESKRNKDTFIGEIGDILKEIGTANK